MKVLIVKITSIIGVYDTMRKINRDFIINVRDYMLWNLPRPNRKYFLIDGELIPLIVDEVDAW